MKYIKPELKVEIIEIKERIASGELDGWIVGEGMEDVGTTTFYVSES